MTMVSASPRRFSGYHLSIERFRSEMQVQGFKEAIKRMKARKKAFAGGKPYKQTAKILSKSIAKNVNSEGRPAWRPRKNQYTHPILDKTGDMRDAAEQSALTWVKSPGGYSNRVTSTNYGAIHQYTGVRTRTGTSLENIVRKFVVIQQAEENQMIQAYRDAFLQE